MKKLLVVLFAFLLVCTSSFAEFMITPGLGFSNFSTTVRPKDIDNTYTKVSYNSMALGLDVAYLMDSGLSFYFNNNVSFLTSGKAKLHTPLLSIDTKILKSKGAFWDAELLAGWTFRDLAPNLRISILGGLGLGYGSVTPTQVSIEGVKLDISSVEQIKTSFFSVGFAIHFNVQYYFTDLVGIGLSITEISGYGKAGMKDVPADEIKGGFANAFNLKLGPTFKF